MLKDRLTLFVSWGIGLAVFLLFFFVIGRVFLNGWSGLSFDFLTQLPLNAGRGGGVFPILVSTLYILMVCMAVSIPIGVGTAVLLTEFSPNGTSFGNLIRRSLDVLAGVPSIGFGLFGNALFCNYLGLGFSILSGGLTLSCMVLPLLIRTTEESLRLVPREMRMSSAALSFSKFTTIFKVILPLAGPGIVAGLVLGVGRALAETAALIFTSGYVDRFPDSILESGRSLSIHIYDLAINVPGGNESASKTAVVLLTLILLINGMIHWSAKVWMNRRVAQG